MQSHFRNFAIWVVVGLLLSSYFLVQILAHCHRVLFKRKQLTQPLNGKQLTK